MSDDWALVARADADAFAQLYRRHHRSVYRYIRSHGYDHELAEDLAADTFVRALTNLDRVRDIGARGDGFRGWLFTIARNLVRDHHKRRSTHREVPAGDWSGVVIPAQRDATDHADTLRDAGALLRGPIAALPSRDRDLLADRFLHGLGPTEIADRDGLEPVAVKAAHYRVMRRLRTELRKAS